MGNIYASCGHKIPDIGEPCLYYDGCDIVWGVLCKDCKQKHQIFDSLEEGLKWVEKPQSQAKEN